VSGVPEELVGAYESWFGPPVTLLPAETGGAEEGIGIVHRRPIGKEVDDPIANATLIGTVGAAAAGVIRGMACELAFEVRGTLDGPAIRANAEALAFLARVPLRTGKMFVLHDLLSNLSLPAFPGFDTALLVDWDPVDGFRFLPPFQGIGLLRVLPLLPSEVDHVERFEDRGEGYLSLFNRGMDEVDPEREPAA
jgi:hypothetical protein